MSSSSSPQVLEKASEILSKVPEKNRPIARGTHATASDMETSPDASESQFVTYSINDCNHAIAHDPVHCDMHPVQEQF